MCAPRRWNTRSRVLALYGSEGKLLAGGQSLVPMMAMRLARPTALIDIKSPGESQTGRDWCRPGCHGVGAQAAGCGRSSKSFWQPVPLLGAALAWVGHSQTRNRGTVGGSLVHADPSAELPLAAVVLDANLTLKNHTLARFASSAAHDFFLGPMFTATGDSECLTEISWPRWPGERVASAFEEVAKSDAARRLRHGGCLRAAASLMRAGCVPVPRLALVELTACRWRSRIWPHG